MRFENSLSFAQQLDGQDPLKNFRDEFIISSVDGKEKIYWINKD